MIAFKVILGPNSNFLNPLQNLVKKGILCLKITNNKLQVTVFLKVIVGALSLKPGKTEVEIFCLDVCFCA